MDFSEARLSRIESQSSTDSSHDQRRKGYFSISKIKNGFHTLSSRGFLRARGDATPQPMDATESVPQFLTNLRLSDLFDLPGEYVLMNAEMLSALSDGKEAWQENMRSHGTPLACLRTDQGDSILHLATKCGQLELVKKIVSKCPCLLLEPNSKDQLPFHVAACVGQSAVVEALVATITFFSAKAPEEKREKLNPYILKDINGDTALNLALKGHNMEVALCLVNADHRTSFLACKEGISPLYLAVEAGDVSLVRAMLGNYGPEERQSNLLSQLEGRRYLAHVALKSMSTDILNDVLNEYPRLVDERDDEGRTCLSFGASMGNYKGVCNLLDRSTKGVFVCDDDGSYPIHVAAEKGHIEVVNEICKRCPISKHLRNRKDHNIFHIAANCGKYNILRQWRNEEHLANEKDVDGNTPLHLATLQWHPRSAYYLAGRKNLLIKNNSGLTALDIAELNLQPHYILMESLTMVALVCRHVESDRRLMKSMKLTRPLVPLDRGANKEYINALIVVAALVATVTFAAGFTLPGGYETSGPNLGLAALANFPTFTCFVILNMVAMQSSVVAVVSLLWAQLGDHALSRVSLRVALPSLCIALVSMSYAFVFTMVIAIGAVAGQWLIIGFSLLCSFFLVMMILIVVPLNFLQNPSVHVRFFVFFLSFVLVISDEER